MPPEVSVIIPAHNVETFIEGALRSVLDQTYQDFEVVIVDDGSTDGTSKIVAALVKQDRRIQYFRHGASRGAQAARNSGIRFAQGNWVAFLDSDDQWLPDSLGARLGLARQKGLQVVHSDCYVLEARNAEAHRFGVPPMQGWVYSELLRRPGPMFPALLVSKTSLSRIGYLDESIVSFQEWDTAIRLAKYYEFGFVADPTFIYDCRREDTISKDLLRTAMGYKQVFLKHRWLILRYSGLGAVAFHLQTIARHYRQANERAKALQYSVLAAALWPFRLGTIFRRAERFLRFEFQR